MTVEDARILVVEDGGLDSAAEQRLRLAHEVLVERVLARDHDREAVALAARPAPLLAQAGHRAGEADRDHRVQRADVDPELECVGRAHSEQLAGEQPLLDLASLSRRVAGSVGREPRRVAERSARELVDQLGRAAALGEDERAQASLHEVGHELRGVGEGTGALTELLVDQLGIPERDRPLGLRSAVVADDGEVEPGQRGGELARVADRRRGEQELRLGAVDARQPAQPPQHVADVRPEDAAVHVRLVHDDVAEVREDVAPAIVVRQDADVEHVRVGQDQVRPFADLPAALALRVAVVDRGPDALDLELVERAHLVLRERLGRVEVERAELGLLGEGGEDGQVEGEALPARGAGGDDEVLAAPRRLPGLGLVRVERVDPASLEPFPQSAPAGRRAEAPNEPRGPLRSRRMRAPLLEAGRPTIPPPRSSAAAQSDGVRVLPGLQLFEALELKAGVQERLYEHSERKMDGADLCPQARR